ncbi:MAG: prolipoprotein diacylglyceryl transferase [Balneolaceae bacterium]|nr:prolipoprotein diacylglyceryl transferase [Balneolaceae bacterium]
MQSTDYFVWDADRVLLDLGFFELRWYSLLFMLAFLIGFFIERKMFKDAGRKEEDVERLLLYVLIATVVGARLGHVIFYDLGYYLRHPAEILAVWHGGLASHGAAVGILYAMYLFVKQYRNMTYLWLADRVVTVVALAGAFIRTGNFFNSEIIGRATDLPWAVVFAKVDMIPRHPTMLYEALLSLGVFILLWVVYRRYNNHPPEGSLFGLFLSLLFGGRLLLEFSKVPQAGFAADWILNMGQLLSIPLIAIGLWLIFSKVDWGKNTESDQ